MGLANVSLAERFLPLVYCEPNDRSICYQNVIDLQETGLLDLLGSLQETASLLIHSQDLRQPFTQEARKALSMFDQCLYAMRTMAEADSFSQEGDALAFEIIASKHDKTIPLAAECFLLNRIEAAFNALSAQFGGRIQACDDTCQKALTLLARDHVMEFYRTLEVLPGNIRGAEDVSNEVIVHVPRVKDGKTLAESERAALFAYTLEMLKLYCYPGIHRTGFAASLTPVVTMGSIGVMLYAENKGFEMLRQVLREQQAISAA
jgi:hypothetical protein